jgi:glycosyltransferase involved in cell wall biosynthesis
METVSILLPVFKPNMVWLQEQLDSIAAQTFRGFRCVISHDGPVPSCVLNEITAILPDERFKVVSASKHLGTYRHVESLISEFGLHSTYFALCDQDDVWLPNKIRSQITHFASSQVSVVSSNGFIVNEQLDSIRRITTFDWFGIAPKYESFGSIRNQLTGASALFRSDRFSKAVPFPENIGVAVHDHWLYLASIATGGALFDPEPMWLYRQHSENQIGASANRRFLSRAAKGLQKVVSIFKNRYFSNDDLVIRQGRFFLKASSERWSPDKLKYDVLSRKLSKADRLKNLQPRILIGSSLESLRVAISQQE